MNFRTISQLPQISNIDSVGSDSLMEVSKALPRDPSIPDDPQRYQSFRVSLDQLGGYIKTLALEDLTQSHYGQEHETMWSWLQRIIQDSPNGSESNKFTLSGNFLEFEHTPEINESITEFNDVDQRVVNVETLRNFSSVNSPLFVNNGAEFSTSYFSVENNLTLETNEAPTVNGEKHNQYLFRVSKTVSNVWTTTESGIFTCYGWIDEETEGEADNAKRWVALEGKLGNTGTEEDWKILQLQPFARNLFCSYVGFTFPVDKGLDLRIRTGFRVGTNSNKYQSTQGSLTNHIANAFVGGIYRSTMMGNAGRSSQPRVIIDPISSSSTKNLCKKVNEIVEFLNHSSCQ